MSAADRARFSAGAAAISASAQQTMNNTGRYNRLKQRKQKQQKDFGRVNLGTHQTPYGGDANNVVKDDLLTILRLARLAHTLPRTMRMFILFLKLSRVKHRMLLIRMR